MTKKKALYLECFSGISGDMMVAALLDLGADEIVLKNVLDSIPVKGFTVKITSVMKSGLKAKDFSVMLTEDNHDHDMNYLYENNYKDITNEKHHFHRGLKEIKKIINDSSMTETAKNIAIKIFNIIGKAEADVHGIPIEEIYFHEVGAVDSIVDIISVAVCLDNLKIDECIVPFLNEGTGTIRCQHGILPVPVPAVLKIAEVNNINLHIMNAWGEYVTPTGAAVVAAIRTSDKLPSYFKVLRTGMGAGKRSYELPGILRAMIIEETGNDNNTICRLETDIDDSTGECLGYVMERLYESGALEVHYVPIYMKKNRPAYELVVLCTEEDRDELEKIIFAETTTIGIRRQDMKRTILEREIESLHTSLGNIKAKKCKINGTFHFYPEYESVAKLCRKNKLNFMDTYQLIERECNE